MRQDVALRVLGQVMRWSDQESSEEFRWLQFMARLKYDGYRDFQAGFRFIENLVKWLLQFYPDDRKAAYNFIRNKLVYIGPQEMQRLVRQFYPRTVLHDLVRVVADKEGIQPYEVFLDKATRKEVCKLRRQTLFMGLSDGARIDGIRRANEDTLNNEQFVIFAQLDGEKWKDLLKKLGEDMREDQEAQFRLVYLIDDFTGTGDSFLRENGSDALGWDGKLIRFYKSILDRLHNTPNKNSIFSSDWKLYIHYYVASARAKDAIQERLNKAEVTLSAEWWAKTVRVDYGTVLPDDLPINQSQEPDGILKAFHKLTRKYYNSCIETEHTAVGGTDNISLGYGSCALPLVLEHNTPNNSVALLWADTDKGDNQVGSSVMVPLFRRHQRHGLRRRHG